MFAETKVFDSDLSPWNPSSAKTIESMFHGASSFDQDLCVWDERLPESVALQSAFHDSACPALGDPVRGSGPYCTVCPGLQPPACFYTSRELQDAVDLYLSDPTGELTASKYGHPIGSWCVGQIGIFDELFSVERNPLAASFNEDISSWVGSQSRAIFRFLFVRRL